MSVGAFQPAWIGAASRQLYSALHPAPGAHVGVVMLPPLLHEQARSRRLLVEVASRLAEVGLPCLRFDYFGTGDSAGASEEHDFAAIHADLDVAVDALRAATAVEHVVLLAWRGAVLPACVWPGASRRVGALAAWEPIADGAAWLNQLEANDRTERAERYSGAQDDLNDSYLMGFPTSRRWRADVAHARLAMPSSVPLWTVAHADAGEVVPGAQYNFELPPQAARFEDGAGIESAMFWSRGLGDVVDKLGSTCMALGG